MGNRKITQLPAASGLSPTDIIVVVNEGVTKRSDIGTLSDEVAALISGNTTTTGVTFIDNILYLTDSSNNVISTPIESFTGVTVNGTISATTVDSEVILSGGTNLNQLFLPITSRPFPGNQDEISLSVSGDSQPTGITLSGSPIMASRVDIILNHAVYTVGDGVKTKAFYFSPNGGFTAKTLSTLAPGDELIFNGIISGIIKLDGNDRISINYNVLK